MEERNKRFAEVIAKRRKERRYSYRMLSMLCGITKGTMTMKLKNPETLSIKELRRIVVLLDITKEEITDFIGSEK